MSDAPARLYILGLGANLGDRVATLKSAVSALKQRGTLRAVSALYESEALGPPQPDYLNAAVLLESALAPEELLGQLLDIERAHGRERRERWGPRTLDLDLLHSPDLVLSMPSLILPHPELTRRAFALAPLLDVAPEARDPRSGTRYAELLRAIAEPNLRLVETSATWFGPTFEASTP
jgi:2-amino-4-hydroxy-6-hydroxymethyldihydropteridine diphosphokinase